MPRARRSRQRSPTAAQRPAAQAAPSGRFEGSVLHRSLVALIALKVVALIIVFDPAGLGAFELTKAQVGRALSWPIAAAVLIAVFQHGFAVIPRSHVHLFVGLYLLATAVSAVFAEVPYLALYGERGNYFGLTFFLDMTVLYTAACVALRRVEDVYIVGGAILAAGIVDAGYSTIQFLGMDPVPWPEDVRRPIGTFGDTVRHGHFLAILFALAASAAVLAPPGRWRRHIRLAAVAMGLGVLALAGIVGSRGFFLGLGGGITALVLLMGLSGRYRPIQMIQVASGLALVTLLAVGALLTTPAGQRASERVVELAAEDRLITYRVALDAFYARPLIGHGPDNFSVGYTRHRTAETGLFGVDIIENSAHNWALQILVTTGLLGLVTFVALIASAGVVLRALAERHRLVAAAVASAAGAHLTTGLVSVGSNAIDWYPWVAIGAVVGLATEPVHRAARHPAPTLASAVVIGLTAVVGISIATPALAASRSALVASSAYAQNAALEAQTHSLEAVRADPGRAVYWNWLGLARSLSGQWKDAGDAFAEAATRAPYDSTFWQNLARARALQSLGGDQSSGGVEAVMAAIRRGIEAEPIERSTYELAVELAYSLGQGETALELAVEAHRRSGFSVSDDFITRVGKIVRVDQAARNQLEALVQVRESAALRVVLAEIALRQGDVDEARRNAERALELEPGNAQATEILSRTGS